MNTFEIVLSEERNVTMTMYLNLESKEFKIKKRPLMMVLPGGGYAMCSDREGEVVALRYLAAGFQVCILRYTLKSKGGWPYPINDYDEAMDKIWANAEEWNIDTAHTAVVGFSAGGHLAACTATIAKHKPTAAILIYPAILPAIVDACQPNMPYPAECVDTSTCPCYLVTARDDSLVRPGNSLTFALALEKAGINFEIHVYSYGQHGFSVATPAILTTSATPRLAGWVQDSIEWLWEVMGTLTDDGFTEPVIPAHTVADGEAFLSVLCSLSHAQKQPEPVQQLLEPLYAGIREIAKAGGNTYEGLVSMIGGFTIKALMETMKQPEAAIQQMQAALNQIPNTK